jgi:hypothetical protein
MKVQNENANIHANTHSLHDLNTRFIEGKRLNYLINKNLKVPSCHGPVTLEWN